MKRIDKNFDASQTKLIRTLTPSENGDLFQILYSIKIFVKHDSVTQRGEGACITLPIRILPAPIKLSPEQKPDEESKEVDNQLLVRSNSVNSDQVKLAIDNIYHTYFEKFINPWELQWRSGELKPNVMTEKEMKQEEQEVKESQSMFEVNVEQEKKVKNNRLPKEL